jgi:hypothetical protein
LARELASLHPPNHAVKPADIHQTDYISAMRGQLPYASCHMICRQWRMGFPNDDSDNNGFSYN